MRRVTIVLMMAASWIAIACTGPPESRTDGSETAADPVWNDYWRARGVSPAPPRDFLDHVSLPPEILNLTNGALSDETVHRWVVADLRRGAGDAWAFTHLRLDVANAGVFGPPGLNGTGPGIEQELAIGTVSIECDGTFDLLAIGVVAVSKQRQSQTPDSYLTDFVIVHALRATKKACTKRLADGRRAISISGDPRKLSWQIDTGEFREDPVVGDHWYQAHGWTCTADTSDPLADICGLVRGRSGDEAGRED